MADETAPRPWGTYELSRDGEREVQVGPLVLRIRFQGDELWLAHRREGEEVAHEEGGTGDGDGELDWARWAVPEGTRELRLSPVFPERPLVARPEDPFHLVRGASLRIYVRVPLHVRIELPGPDPVNLVEIPTLTLSDTWFGDFMDGELMYFLPTTGRRKVLPEHFEPHLAVCTLRLSNESVDDLNVEKIALRVEHLSLFARNDELWSDETTVAYRSAEEGSDISMSGMPPPDAPDARLVTQPRIPAERGFRARTFARLKGLPGFGALS